MKNKIFLLSLVLLLFSGLNVFAQDDSREVTSYGGSLGRWVKADVWEGFTSIDKDMKVIYVMAFLNGFYASGLWLSMLFNTPAAEEKNLDYKLPPVDKLFKLITFKDSVDIIIARIDSFYRIEKNKEVAFWRAMLYLYKGYILE